MSLLAGKTVGVSGVGVGGSVVHELIMRRPAASFSPNVAKTGEAEHNLA